MNRFPSLLEYDLAAGARLGVRLVAGADEVGRACLAGPLVAAACLFDWEALTPAELDRLARLRDSKKLTPARRRELRPVITELAVCVAVAWSRRPRSTATGLTFPTRARCEKRCRSSSRRRECASPTGTPSRLPI